MKLHVGVLALGSLAVAAPAVAQQSQSDSLLTVNHFLDLEQVNDPQISPDGKTIVYGRRWIDKQNDKWEAAIWVMNADGTKNRFLVKGSSPVWSPDGTRLAYVAAAESPKGPQIFVRYMDAEGGTSQVTRVTEAPGSVKWSPDGKWLSFTKLVPKTEATSLTIDMPAAPLNAKWTPGPRVVERLHYRMDRSGYSEVGFNHLFVVPADGGTARQLTSGDWSVGNAFDGLTFGAQYNWLPNGKTIVIEGLNEPDADLTYRDGNIYAVDVATATIKRLTPERGSWSHPVVSPDGSKISYAGYPFVKQTYRVADLYVMNADGTGGRNISSGLDRDVNGAVIWARDGSGLYASPEDRGTANIVFIPVSGAGATPVTKGNHVLRLGSMSGAGVMTGVRSTFQNPGDIVRVNLDAAKKSGQVTELTAVNEDLLQGKRLATVEEIWYPSSGGARVQGWIVKPPSFSPNRKYPLLLEIHGGPHGMYNVGFDYMWQTWAASDVVVLYTNPRGSTGYGTAFGNAIDQAYPSVDYDDLMAGVDTVIGRGYIDDKQLYVAGCSGGGVLTSWVIGHTKRFTAAAVRCPVIDWISFSGHTDVPLFTRNFFDKPFWESPDQWLKQSPLMYVGNVTTPTMLMTGVLDMRTPMPQSEEYYTALKMRGVPTALLRFEGEWHGTESIPSNWIRTQLYMMRWFKKFTKPTS